MNHQNVTLKFSRTLREAGLADDGFDGRLDDAVRAALCWWAIGFACGITVGLIAARLLGPAGG